MNYLKKLKNSIIIKYIGFLNYFCVTKDILRFINIYTT